MGITHRKSFTLIELIVAVGVVGFILPAVFSIFFTIIRQQLVLVAYQEMKYQGDSVQRNIINLLQNRASNVTNSTHTLQSSDICPLPLSPTPTYSPAFYVGDRDGAFIHLSQAVLLGSSSNTVASASVNFDQSVNKTYDLTSNKVSITNLGFTCVRINEFTPPIISAQFTVQKSTTFKDISLPYAFNVRLRNY